VLLTLLCVVLGWLSMQFNWARNRQEALRWVESINSREFHIVHSDGLGIDTTRAVNAPWSVRILGEPGIRRITLEFPRGTPDDSLKHAERKLKRLFPEATIYVMHEETPEQRRKRESSLAEADRAPH